MSDTDKKPYQDRLTTPPKALWKAKRDTIAIVPASMLPLTKTLQEVLTTLPKGAVFLCHAEENTRQRKLLERVEETFREQGHTVLRIDTMCHEGLASQKVMRFSHLTFRKQNMPQTV